MPSNKKKSVINNKITTKNTKTQSDDKSDDDKSDDVLSNISDEYENTINDECEEDSSDDIFYHEGFDEEKFKEINAKIKFHVFDPENNEADYRQEISIVPTHLRRTSDAMTNYEFTEVISHRAKQIENGGLVYTNVDGESDPIKMAEIELRKRKCPLSIRRKLTNNLVEIWDVNEMIHIY